MILKLKNTNFTNIKALFFKCFIGYKDAKKIRPLCIFLPKMNAYRRGFDRTKCMPFLVIEEKLFEK